jgi:hypothetical protein
VFFTVNFMQFVRFMGRFLKWILILAIIVIVIGSLSW